jgi:hypothetical protein
MKSYSGIAGLRANRAYLWITAFIPAMLISGCAGSSAPSGWLSKPSDLQGTAFGCWISVKLNNKGAAKIFDGEFIAIDGDSIYILPEDGDLEAVYLKSVSSAKLTRYYAGTGELVAWTIGGTVSTISHGFIAAISAPSWVIWGTITTVAQSYQPQLNYPAKDWEQLKINARFPQGLSPELPRYSIIPKLRVYYR